MKPKGSGHSSVQSTALLKRDALRYRWLRAQYAEGRETYLAEFIVSADQLDEYIDKRSNKEVLYAE